MLKQQNTALETAMGALVLKYEQLHTTLEARDKKIAELQALKEKIAELHASIDKLPDHNDAVAKLQKDMISLHAQLGVSIMVSQ